MPKSGQGPERHRDRDDEMNPRTCIVSRKTFDKDELIRFVAGPDGNGGAGSEGKSTRARCLGGGQKTGRSDRRLTNSCLPAVLKMPVKADAALADLVERLARRTGIAGTGAGKEGRISDYRFCEGG